jgi:glycosyltransferase involved in cell wall biosynthesis
MKIAMVHNTYQQAGGEDIVFESERRLLERAGHHVVSYVRSNMELEKLSVLTRIAIAPRIVWSSATHRAFAAFLDAEHPDIVHVHNTFMVISPSIYSACTERSIPVVQTLHNFRLLCPAANFYRDGQVCEECLDVGLLSSVCHGCYRHSRLATAGIALMLAFHRKLNTWKQSVSRYIVLTDFAKDKFVAAGFPPDKIAVKPNFVDPDPCERTHAGDYAIFTGRLAEDKGLRVLLNAWAQLPAQYPLHIVGDGPERGALEAQARELRLANITFRGRLSHNDAIEAIKKAQFIVVPSTWYETFGMCIAESFACGTPVLCSRLGAMKELVTDHGTGLHFNPNDAQDLASKVEWAWNHPAKLAEMGRAARRRYETDFTAEKNYSLLMRIYEQTVATHAERPQPPSQNSRSELQSSWRAGTLHADA